MRPFPFLGRHDAGKPLLVPAGAVYFRSQTAIFGAEPRQGPALPGGLHHVVRLRPGRGPQGIPQLFHPALGLAYLLGKHAVRAAGRVGLRPHVRQGLFFVVQASAQAFDFVSLGVKARAKFSGVRRFHGPDGLSQAPDARLSGRHASAEAGRQRRAEGHIEFKFAGHGIFPLFPQQAVQQVRRFIPERFHGKGKVVFKFPGGHGADFAAGPPGQFRQSQDACSEVSQFPAGVPGVSGAGAGKGALTWS